MTVRRPRLPKPDLVGREDDLQRLHEALLAGTAAITAALKGQGGIGKTQLAVLYGHEYAEQWYPGGVYWVSAFDPRTIADQLSGYAAELGLEVSGGPAEDFTALRARRFVGWLEGRADALLILDDIQDETFFRRPLPGIPHCTLAGLSAKILATTRLERLDGAGMLALDVLSREAARRLVAAESGLPDAPQAEVIAALLGDLPLLLRLAGGWLRETGAGYGALIDRLRASGLVETLEQVPDDERPADYDRRLVAMMNQSWEGLSAAGRELMHLMACLPVNRVAGRDLLAALLGGDRLAGAVKAVRKRSLAEIGEDGSVRVHHLIHDFVAKVVPPGFAAGIGLKASRTLVSAEFLSTRDAAGLLSLGGDLAMLIALAEGEARSRLEGLRKAIELQSHALAIEQDGLAQLHLQACRLGYDKLAAEIEAARAHRPGRWLRQVWSSIRHDPALVRVLTAASGDVLDFSVSADGTVVAAVTHGGFDYPRLLMWHRDGRPWQDGFDALERPFAGCALVDDGMKVATVSADGWAELWDCETATALARVYVPLDQDQEGIFVAQCRVDETGQRLLVLGPRVVWLVDFQAESVVWDLPVKRRVFAATGDIRGGLVAVHDGEELIVWRNGPIANAWRRRASGVQTVRLAAGGKLHWNLGNSVWWGDAGQDKGAGLEIGERTGFVFSITVDDAGHYLLLGCSNGRLLLFDIDMGQLVGHVAKAGGRIERVELSRDGRWAITRSFSSLLSLWSVADMVRESDEIDVSHAWAGAIRADGSIISLDADGGLWRHGEDGHATLVAGLNGEGEVADGALSRDGEWAVTVTEGGLASVFRLGWDKSKTFRVGRWKSTEKQPAEILLGGGRVALLYGEPNRVEIWEGASGKKLATLRPEADEFIHAALSPCGTVVGMLDIGGVAHLRAVDGKTASTLTCEEDRVASSICLGAGGKRVALGALDGSITLFEADGSSSIAVQGDQELEPAAFGADGTLTCLQGGNRVVLVRPDGAQVSLTAGATFHLSLSSSGDRLLLVGEDGSLSLFELVGQE